MAPTNPLLTWLHRKNVRGRHRVHGILTHLGVNSLVCFETRFGAKLLLDPYEYVDGIILRHGFYESEVFEALRPHLAAGGTFWDIGSNTGLHDVSAKVCYPNLNVVCFEPVPLLANRILESARLNGVSLMAYSSALGSSPGVTWITVTPGNLGMSNTRDDVASELVCAVQTGDNVIASQRVPPPTVVKIDTEGSEAEILAGMAGALESVRAIALESDPEFAKSSQHPLRKILDRYGFRYRQLVRAEPTEHNLENYIAER